MGFWRRQKAPRGVTAVVGLMRGDSLHVLRGTRDPLDGSRTIHGEAVLRLDDFGRLATLLQERLGWSAEEPVYVGGPSPLMVGSALSLTVPRYEEGHAVVRDTREVLHEAQWRAADTVREEAATYFGCPLEDIGAFGMSVEHWRETADGVAATVFQLCGPRWGNTHPLAFPPDVPRAGAVTLPVLLADGVGSGDTPEAVFHVEDEFTALTVRHVNRLCRLRSLHIGMAMVREHIEGALDCSPREAERLMALAPTGQLSANSQRTLDRILRTVLPLWSGMFQVLAAGMPLAERPRRLVVTGIFPRLVAKYFCRPHILSRSLGGPCSVDILPDDRGEASGLSPLLHAMLRHVTHEPRPVSRLPRVSLGVLTRT